MVQKHPMTQNEYVDRAVRWPTASKVRGKLTQNADYADTPKGGDLSRQVLNATTEHRSYPSPTADLVIAEDYDENDPPELRRRRAELRALDRWLASPNGRSGT